MLTPIGNENDEADAVALQPDGKIIVGGYTVHPTTTDIDLALARYLPDGSLDTTFSGDGKVTTDAENSEVYSILLRPDGKIVVVGTNALARYLPDGTLDPSFGDDGLVIVDFSQFAGALQPDGKIVAAGQVFNTSTSQFEFALARYLPDGTLDATFASDGRVNTDAGGSGFAKAVAVQADGKIIAAGDVASVSSGHVEFALVRYLPDGTLDPTFSDDGLVTTSFGADDSSFIQGLVIQPHNGRLVAAGSSSRTGEGGFDFALAGYETGLVPGKGPPRHKHECKRGGWREFTIPRAFINQGDCIQFVNTGK